MTYFKDTAEVHQYIGGIFEAAVTDAEIGPKMAESGVVLKLTYADPDAVVVVDMPNQRVFRGETDEVKPNVAMSMKADVGHKFWLGKVNVPMALAKGEMRAKGPMPKILKLLPLAQALFPKYAESLEAEGRSDLLAV